MFEASMSLRTNSSAMSASRHLNGNNRSLSKNLESIASGLKITNASLDSSGLAISQKMRMQIKMFEQSSLNSQDGISLVQTAEGAMKEIHDILGRMLEMSLKSMSGTLAGELDRDALQEEFLLLSDEINRISETIEFNGVKLLDGSISSDPNKNGMNIHLGENNLFDSVSVAVSDMRTKNLGLDKLSIETIEQARRSASSIKNIINIVSENRSSLGAIENRLDHAFNSLNSSAESTASAHSRIMDADIAKKMMEYTKDSVLTFSSQTMLSHAILKPQSVLGFITGSTASTSYPAKTNTQAKPTASTSTKETQSTHSDG